MNTKIKIILAFIIGVIVSGVSVYAATQYLASEVEYKDTTVEGALNDLYTVHETYKNLTTETTADAGDILSGKTAYDNLGNLITGTISTNCVYGTYNHAKNTQIDINVGFAATYALLSFTNSNDTYHIIYNGSKFYQNRLSQSDFSELSNISITSTGIYGSSGTTSTKYTDAYTIKYMACK